MIRLAGDKQLKLFHLEFRRMISQPLHLYFIRHYSTCSLSSCLPNEFTAAFLLLTFMNDLTGKYESFIITQKSPRDQLLGVITRWLPC